MTRVPKLPIALSSCAIAAMLTLAALAGAQPALADGPADAPTPPAVEMHRLYNPNSGEHFYTADAAERGFLAGVGWRYEGIGWTAPAEGDDVYRLYNPNAGDHHYTPSADDRDMLVLAGWRYEGVGWKSGGGVPLYREYNPNAEAGAHNYTADAGEHRALVGAGWRDEGIAWNAVAGGAPADAGANPQEHVHNWVAQTKPVTVTDVEAWDEDVYDTVWIYVCNCGYEAWGGLSDLTAHEYAMHPDDDPGCGTAPRQTLVNTIHHDAVTHEEPVITGYVCSGCGATKGA